MVVVYFEIDGRGMVDEFWSLYVVGHVHIHLSYFDRFGIGLVLDDARDNVMVTHYLDVFKIGLVLDEALANVMVTHFSIRWGGLAR